MIDRDCANCKHHTEDGCSSWDCEFEAKDLISRADAIEAWDKLSKRGRTEFDQVLMTLPSVEAEWIPCSERLPSEDGLYLIQTNYMYHGIPNMDVYYWADGWNCIRLLNGMVKREYEIDGIVAWMPLPKPYREDGEE